MKRPTRDITCLVVQVIEKVAWIIGAVRLRHATEKQVTKSVAPQASSSQDTAASLQ